MRNGYQNLSCGLVGEHLGHSFSPQIHAELGDYTYRLIELPSDDLKDFFSKKDFDALNVTIPYKKSVIPFLDVISEEAKAIGAVNTIVRCGNKLYGYNTDYFGFDSLLQHAKLNVAGKKALILGSGGASLTVRTVLAHRGAREIVIISRHGENNYDNITRHSDAGIIVNATPVGMYPNNGNNPIDLSKFPDCTGVADLIYNPAKTALLLQAEQLGIPHANGLYMLVAQAAKAAEYFTGAPIESGEIARITRHIEEKTRNIILVGMPGCGKTTIGRCLSEKLHLPFWDADDAFTQAFGQTPASVITEQGEPAFRDMEHRILSDLGKKSGCVIATGGGAVTREENYAPLRQNGVIIFLHRKLSKLDTAGRPLSLARSVEEIYRERLPAYQRFADFRIESAESPEQTADKILTILQSQNDR